jgi:hypothetical protein
MFDLEQYKSAIDALTLGLNQLQPDGNQCAICGDSDHQAFECNHNPLVRMREAEKKEATWRCYHCGEVFYDSESARKHFGNIPTATPLCILRKCLCLNCPANPTECHRGVLKGSNAE